MPSRCEQWLGEADISVAETVRARGARHSAVEGQERAGAARRPQRLARCLERARHARQRRAGRSGARRPARPERPVGRGGLCRRRLGAGAAERALSRADGHRRHRRRRQGGTAHRRRRALRHADRREGRSCPRSRCRMPASSATRPGRCTPSSTRSGAASPPCGATPQAGLDVVVPIRALADWVQVRQRLGAIPAIKTVSVRIARIRSRRAASRLLRHRRAAPEDAGPGRAAARQGCRQVALAGAVTAPVTRWRFWLGVAAGFLLLLWLLNDILLPFVVGAVVAYFFDPVVVAPAARGPVAHLGDDSGDHRRGADRGRCGDGDRAAAVRPGSGADRQGAGIRRQGGCSACSR